MFDRIGCSGPNGTTTRLQFALLVLHQAREVLEQIGESDSVFHGVGFESNGSGRQELTLVEKSSVEAFFSEFYRSGLVDPI